jgi:hypothetical protein
MAVISFRFSASADKDDQELVLGKLRKLTGVKSVGRVDAESQDEDISRMCFAETIAAHVPLVVEELHQTSKVKDVAVEPRRGLIE